MPECALCGKPSLAYVRVYQNRRKSRSYPVCVAHGLWLLGYKQFAQDALRKNLAELGAVFGIGKGTIPRIEVAWSP